MSLLFDIDKLCLEPAVDSDIIRFKRGIMLHLENEFYTKVKSFDRSMRRIKTGFFARVSSERNDHLKLTGDEWVRCREIFHRQSSMNYILYAHPQYEGKNVAAFIRAVEVRMNHRLFSEFGPTNARNVSWIKPAAFWQRGHVRQSLFTVLLRCARHYKRTKDNFNEALHSEYFAKNTKEAIEWFMAGNTWYRGSSSEIWYKLFSPMSTEEIKKSLTKKPIRRSQLMDFALQKLNMSQEQLEQAFRRSDIDLPKSEIGMVNTA